MSRISGRHRSQSIQAKPIRQEQVNNKAEIKATKTFGQGFKMALQKNQESLKGKDTLKKFSGTMGTKVQTYSKHLNVRAVKEYNNWQSMSTVEQNAALSGLTVSEKTIHQDRIFAIGEVAAKKINTNIHFARAVIQMDIVNNSNIAPEDTTSFGDPEKLSINEGYFDSKLFDEIGTKRNLTWKDKDLILQSYKQFQNLQRIAPSI